MKKILPALLIGALTFAVYSPALQNGFVWDDTALIQRDPLIRSWRLIPEGFQHFLFTDATASDFYRPVQRLTYTLDYAAFAFRAVGFHLSSIVCHIAAALALLALSSELLRLLGVEEPKRRIIAFVATLIWSIHPVHNAAVAYISGRADPLAAAFGFLGLYCAIRSLRTTRAPRLMLLGLAGALFLLSSLSKETGLIFVVLWAAVLLLTKKWKELLPATVVILFVAVIYVTLRLPAVHVPAPRLHGPIPLLVRPIVAARAFAEYTGLILFPINLHMDRDVETRPEGPPEARANIAAWRELQTLLGLLIMSAAIYWLVRSRKRDPAVFCCLVLGAIAYLPVSGVFPLNASIAEHWIYLPLAFLSLATSLAISRLAIPRSVLTSFVAVCVLLLGARTWMRTSDWKTQRTFFERTIARGGDSARMLIGLAGVELQEGQLEAAKKLLMAALQKEPGHPIAALNLGAVAIRQNDFATARELLNRAVKMPLVEAQAHELLAVLEHKETGNVNARRLHLASRTGPPNWSIEKRYVKLLDETGATEQAIAELKKCLRTQWYRAESWQLLSELLAKAGRNAEAAAAKDRANAYDVHLASRPGVL